MNVRIKTMFEHVQTERLILRKPTSEDTSFVFAIHGDPQTNQYNPHGPMKNITEAVERMERWQCDWVNDGFGYWSILHPNSQEVIGFGGIRRMQLTGRDVLNKTGANVSKGQWLPSLTYGGIRLRIHIVKMFSFQRRTCLFLMIK